MNKQAYEHIVGLIINKQANDPSKYKDMDDFVNNGRRYNSIGKVKGRLQRRKYYDVWQIRNKVNQAAKSTGTYRPGMPNHTVVQGGVVTNINGVNIPSSTNAKQPTHNTPAVNTPVAKTPVVRKPRLLREETVISDEASEY